MAVPVSKPGARPARPAQAGASSPFAATTETLASPGTRRTIWQSWLALSPPTRMLMGIGVAVFAVGGMYVSDKLQTKFPAPESEADKRKKNDGTNHGEARRFGIRVVDKVDAASGASGTAPSSSSSAKQ